MGSGQNLVRAVGLFGAVMMGLGSIVGTGVFVSLGLAAGTSGPAMIFALVLAGMLATCNGLSTAQLAADHPMSGGSYEYGYKYLGGLSGYLAGWLFLCAKSASAATAALGFGGYLIKTFGIKTLDSWQIGLIATLLIVCVAAYGIKRSNLANIIIVAVTVMSLVIYVVVLAVDFRMANFSPFFQNFANDKPMLSSLFEATALMFVAYTGYGRVATLGEEIKDPVKNIPKAVILTLMVSSSIYLLVAIFSIGGVGSQQFYLGTINSGAPLEYTAAMLNHPFVSIAVSIGAMTAMLGVLLNLVLGLSRVIFAMGRKNDLPSVFASIDSNRHSPVWAILSSGLIIVGLVMLKDIQIAWAFSAFTVLLYYAITNICALRLSKDKRLYPRLYAWIGLFGCLSLGFWVDGHALQLGFAVIAVGLMWRFAYRLYQKKCSV